MRLCFNLKWPRNIYYLRVSRIRVSLLEVSPRARGDLLLLNKLQTVVGGKNKIVLWLRHKWCLLNIPVRFVYTTSSELASRTCLWKNICVVPREFGLCGRPSEQNWGSSVPEQRGKRGQESVLLQGRASETEGWSHAPRSGHGSWLSCVVEASKDSRS